AVCLVEVDAEAKERTEQAHVRMMEAVEASYHAIRRIQHAARRGNPEECPRWPMLILRSPKGWTGVREVDGKPVEGSFRSHQVPIPDPKTNPEHLALLENWLRSYRPEELFDAEGRPDPALLEMCPQGARRMGMNPN